MIRLPRRALLAAPLLATPTVPPAGKPARMRAVRFTIGAWARQVVVENKVGATGRLAIEELIRADADGTTILITPASMVTIYPHLYGNRLRYSPMTDMQAVSPVVLYPFALAVGPAAPNVTNLAQFIDFAKARNGISYASPAAGSVPHFTGVMLARAAGIELTHLPYRGAAPAITDTIAGQIPATINVIGDQVEHHRANRLKMIAVTSPQRMPRFPEVATFAEQGYPDLTADEWFGAFLPARAPAAMVQALNAALVAAAANPELRQNLENREFEAFTSSSADFAARIQRETTKWGPVVQESGFRPED